MPRKTSVVGSARHTSAPTVMRPARTALSSGLAAAFLAGPWEVDAMVERGAEALGGRRRGLKRLAGKVVDRFPEPPLGRPRRLAAFIAKSASLRRARIRHWYVLEPSMAQRHARLAELELPQLRGADELAQWLGLELRHLAWFADQRHSLRHAEPRLRHYHYTWVAKRSGTHRLIEAPKRSLKQIQQRILRDILATVPVHEAAHGFRRGRSVISHAAPHVGHAVVIRLDLADFFASIHRARISALFAALGYPDGVAESLAGLCCTTTPGDVLALCPQPQSADRLGDRHELRQRLAQAHLAQGAPTSPALANLAAFRLDRRLSGLASRWGCRYSRYADDLAFSGERRLAGQATTFIGMATAIVRDEGFSVRLHKTRVMQSNLRQQLTGIVVNQRINLRRADLERLEAILFNCVRKGPSTQNRDGHDDFRAHLAGRVAWAEHVSRSARTAHLRRLLEAIQW